MEKNIADWPIQYLERLGPALRVKVAEVRHMLMQQSGLGHSVSSHRERLDQVDGLLQDHVALQRFLSNPTRRLGDYLESRAMTAEVHADWLVDHRPSGLSMQNAADYWACTVHIQLYVHDWRLAVQLEQLVSGLDEADPEPLH